MRLLQQILANPSQQQIPTAAATMKQQAASGKQIPQIFQGGASTLLLGENALNLYRFFCCWGAHFDWIFDAFSLLTKGLIKYLIGYSMNSLLY